MQEYRKRKGTIMLVTLKSFGSVWSRRGGKGSSDPKRFVRVAYYNTTGIQMGNGFQYRWKIGGDVRFYGVGSGFDPNYPFRALHETFECYEPEIWQGHNRIAVKHRVSTQSKTDYYLIVTTAEQTGGIAIDNEQWKAAEVILVSFSQWKDRQEIMLLMPAYSWIKGKLGTFCVEPSLDNGALRLGYSGTGN